MTIEELDVFIGSLVRIKELGFSCEVDNDGQFVIYTGLWEDEDGDLHLENPADDEDDE